MNGLPRNQQDFSDIDNLGRATESFMKVQRKALEQRRSVRAPRNHTTWFGAHIKQISVTAALVLVCGLAAFFGIRFAAGHDELRQPEPEITAFHTTVGTEAEPAEESEPESTEPPAGSETERLMPAVTPNNTERQSASTTAPRDTTAEREQPAATTPSVSSRQTETAARQTVTNAPATTTVSTTTPRSASVPHVSTSTTHTTASTSRTTASTSRTTASASRTTASTSASTSRTTASTSRTTVTTTQPAQAKLEVLSVRVRDGYADSSGKYRQTVRVFLRNTGNAPFSGSKSLSISVTGCSSIQHVGCSTGNAGNLSYSGSGITLTYAYSGLAVNADDTVTLSVISDKPITSVRLV